MRKSAAFPLAAAVLTLAACGSSGSSQPAPAHSSSPSPAMTVLQKIPGVTQCAPATPDPEDLTEATCNLPDGSLVELATFATQADEMQWIGNGGAGAGPPDPSYAGCCVQGNLWAATISAPGYTSTAGTAPVINTIGGRVVNG